MTNHPGRRRDDEQPEPAEIPAAEAAAEPGPPAHTANGHVPPGLQPNAAKLIGQAAGEAIGPVLAQMLSQLLPGALAAVLQQVPVHVAPGPCGPCTARRAAWLSRHAAVLAQAEAALWAARAAQAGLPPDQQVPVDPRDFLPEALRPSADPASPNPDAMPDSRQGEVLIGGTWYCQADTPAPPDQPDEPAEAKKPLLYAQGPLSTSLIAEAMRAPYPT